VCVVILAALAVFAMKGGKPAPEDGRVAAAFNTPLYSDAAVDNPSYETETEPDTGYLDVDDVAEDMYDDNM
jgi:hypothetical protein